MRGPSRGKPPGPSLTTTWGLVAWLAVPLALVRALGTVGEPDVFWHILMGQDILSARRFTGDPGWTYGPHVPDWVTTQPASEVVLHLAHAVASWPGVLLLKVLGAGLFTASLLLAMAQARASRIPVYSDRAVVLVGLLVIGGVGPALQERPQLVSLILLPWVGLLALRVMYADRWPRWWVLGLALIVWSWFHGGGIVVVPVLLAATVVHALVRGGRRFPQGLGRSLARGWPALLVAILAPMVGPAGWGYYAQVERIREAAGPFLLEWFPVWTEPGLLLLPLVVVAVWALSAILLTRHSGRRWRALWMDALLLGGLLAVSLTSIRYLVVWFLLAAPLVARRLGQAWTRPPDRWELVRPRVARVVLAAASVVAMTVVAFSLPRTTAVTDADLARVWAGLREAPGERRLVVDYSAAGQAELQAGVPVSIDGRADRYGPSVIYEHALLTQGQPGWENTWQRYPGTTDVVVDRGSLLVAHLRAQGWREACVGVTYVWLVAPGLGGSCPQR